jgi:hypothetical protein
LLSDIKRPDRPRRRDKICSFQVATLRSILGIMDWVTNSRIKVRRLLMSESGRYGVGSVTSSAVSVQAISIREAMPRTVCHTSPLDLCQLF